MSLIVSESSNFTPHEAGVFAARCTRIIDLGTQTGSYQGKPTSSRKIYIGFDTAEVDDDGNHRVVGNRYTASLGDKAILRKDLESWRGRKFTPQELKAFDLKNILGKGCLINIVHDESSGKTYANIKAIMPLQANMTPPNPTGKTVFFSLSDFDRNVFDSLSDNMKKTIEKSPEYQGIASNGHGPVGAGGKGAQAGFDDMDDDIPF